MNIELLNPATVDRACQALDDSAAAVLRRRWTVYYAVILAYGLALALVLRSGNGGNGKADSHRQAAKGETASNHQAKAHNP